MERKTCSIIVSVYNEEAVLRLFYDELEKVLRQLDFDAEVLFVDDGSTDGSRTILDSLSREAANVRIVHFTRNFGHEAAMIAGIDHATGDAVVCMDADLQNPPAELRRMLDMYRQGKDIVTMMRKERADGGWTKHITSKMFYWLMNRLSDTRMVPEASDFFLLSRRVCDVLRSNYRERSRLLRGMVQTVGFDTATLSYSAPARAAGESHYSLTRLAKLALTSMASFSKAPLRLGIYAGLVFVLLSGVLLIYSLVMWMIDKPIGGYTTLIIFLSAFAGILLTVVGIIGYYVGLILDEVKARPIYLVESITGGGKKQE